MRLTSISHSLPCFLTADSTLVLNNVHLAPPALLALLQRQLLHSSSNSSCAGGAGTARVATSCPRLILVSEEALPELEQHQITTIKVSSVLR